METVQIAWQLIGANWILEAEKIVWLEFCNLFTYCDFPLPPKEHEAQLIDFSRGTIFLFVIFHFDLSQKNHRRPIVLLPIVQYIIDVNCIMW